MQKQDDRVPAKWTGQMSTKYLFELYAVARNALIDAGKGYVLDDMRRQMEAAKSQQESLAAIQRHVRFD